MADSDVQILDSDTELCHERQQQVDPATGQEQQQQRAQTLQRRRYYSAYGSREQLRNLRSARRQLQSCSHLAQSTQLQRPFSSVHPRQQLQQCQNQHHPQDDVSALSSTSAAPDLKGPGPVVLFDVSKKERGDPSSTYKLLARQLQAQGAHVEVNHEGALTMDRLQHVSVVVLAQPSQPFSSSEMKALRDFLHCGRSVLAMVGEGGEVEAKTNINYFLEEYGLTICSDAVVRTVVAAPAYLHPKETLIADGILCEDPAGRVQTEKAESAPESYSSRRNSGSCSTRRRSVGSCAAAAGGNSMQPSPSAGSPGSGGNEGAGQAVDCSSNHVDTERLLSEESSSAFVFPYGATVSVQAPAFPFLSSGLIAFPPRRPLGAAYVDPSSDGRLVALGSYRMFDDTFLCKESNTQLQRLVFAWLLREKPADALRPRQELDQPCSGGTEKSAAPAATGDAGVDADLAERSQTVPDTASLAERIMPCFQESDHRLPPDFHDLHEEKLYSVNLDMLPEVKRVYKQLNVEYEPLTMIEPEFEVPLPRYVMAVHPPLQMDKSPPPLELFDLDEEVASPRSRLAYLTNRCTDANLAYYVQEAAEILGYERVPQASELNDDPQDEETAKRILWSIFAEIADSKDRQARMGVSRGARKERESIPAPRTAAAQRDHGIE